MPKCDINPELCHIFSLKSILTVFYDIKYIRFSYGIWIRGKIEI